MPYIVINENEIVKAEMERPERPHPAPPDWNIDTFIQARKKFQRHCLSLPRIAIQGKHNWKVWQEVPESEVRYEHQIYVIAEDKWVLVHPQTYGQFIGKENHRRIIAIPIQSTPEAEKPNCSQHKKELFGQSDMKVVAEAIGDLHYETLMQLLYELSKKIENDAIKDNDAGREKLAAELQYAGMSIFESSLRMERVYKISKPFMNNDNTQTPS